MVPSDFGYSFYHISQFPAGVARGVGNLARIGKELCPDDHGRLSSIVSRMNKTLTETGGSERALKGWNDD